MRKMFSFISAILLLIIFGALAVYNFWYNDTFFEASLTSLMTMAIAIVVSYFLVQRKTDRRRKNEKIDKLLYKIQEYVNSEDFISGGEGVGRKNLMLHRSIYNKIKSLKDIGLENNVQKELDKIEKAFSKFREIYGENYYDEEKLLNKYDELKNYLIKIDDECDKIHIMLM